MRLRWVALFMYTVLIFIPIFRNHIPSGQDYFYHLQRIDLIARGITQSLPYYGDYIVGYPLILISRFGIPIDISFMWFNYIALWLVGICLYLLVSGLFSWNIGIIALCMLFSSPAIWNLYDTGAIYDLLTVGVLLPLTLICLVKIKSRLKKYSVMVVLIILGLALHTVGIINVIPKVYNGSIISEPTMVGTSNFIILVGVPMMLFASFLIGYFSREWQRITVTKEAIIIGSILVAIIGLFTPLALFNVTGFSFRFSINLAIVISIFVICLMGLFLKIQNNRQVDYLAWGTTLTAGIPIIITYLH